MAIFFVETADFLVTVLCVRLLENPCFFANLIHVHRSCESEFLKLTPWIPVFTGMTHA